jgi:hypothetical protein
MTTFTTEDRIAMEKAITLEEKWQLTNEEISAIRDEFLSPQGCNIYTFARAILKKAQEK